MTTEEKVPEVKQERLYKIGPVFCDVCGKRVYTLIRHKEGKILIPELHLTLNDKSVVSIPTKCKDGHKNIIQIGNKKEGEMNMANPSDPNAGKRASLEAQIKGLTTARDAVQKNADSLTARINDLQNQLNALPAAPVAPPPAAK